MEDYTVLEEAIVARIRQKAKRSPENHLFRQFQNKDVEMLGTVDEKQFEECLQEYIYHMNKNIIPTIFHKYSGSSPFLDYRLFCDEFFDETKRLQKRNQYSRKSVAQPIAAGQCTDVLVVLDQMRTFLSRLSFTASMEFCLEIQQDTESSLNPGQLHRIFSTGVLRPLSLTRQQCDILISRFPCKTNPHKLSPSDFLHSLIPVLSLSREKNVRRAFEKLDLDRDAAISLEEVLSLLYYKNDPIVLSNQSQKKQSTYQEYLQLWSLCLRLHAIQSQKQILSQSTHKITWEVFSLFFRHLSLHWALDEDFSLLLCNLFRSEDQKNTMESVEKTNNAAYPVAGYSRRHRIDLHTWTTPETLFPSKDYRSPLQPLRVEEVLGELKESMKRKSLLENALAYVSLVYADEDGDGRVDQCQWRYANDILGGLMKLRADEEKILFESFGENDADEIYAARKKIRCIPLERLFKEVWGDMKELQTRFNHVAYVWDRLTHGMGEREGEMHVDRVLDKIYFGKHPEVMADIRNEKEVREEWKKAMILCCKGNLDVIKRMILRANALAQATRERSSLKVILSDFEWESGNADLVVDYPSFVRFHSLLSALMENDTQFVCLVRSVWGTEELGSRSNSPGRNDYRPSLLSRLPSPDRNKRIVNTAIENQERDVFHVAVPVSPQKGLSVYAQGMDGESGEEKRKYAKQWKDYHNRYRRVFENEAVEGYRTSPTFTSPLNRVMRVGYGETSVPETMEKAKGALGASRLMKAWAHLFTLLSKMDTHQQRVIAKNDFVKCCRCVSLGVDKQDMDRVTKYYESTKLHGSIDYPRFVRDLMGGMTEERSKWITQAFGALLYDAKKQQRRGQEALADSIPVDSLLHSLKFECHPAVVMAKIDQSTVRNDFIQILLWFAQRRGVEGKENEQMIMNTMSLQDLRGDEFITPQRFMNLMSCYNAIYPTNQEMYLLTHSFCNIPISPNQSPLRERNSEKECTSATTVSTGRSEENPNRGKKSLIAMAAHLPQDQRLIGEDDTAYRKTRNPINGVWEYHARSRNPITQGGRYY